MTFLLPLVAFALALAAPLLSRKERGRLESLRLLALLALLATAALVIYRGAPEVDRVPASVGLVLGALACVLGSWGGGMAFGVAVASALHLLSAVSLPTAGMALVAGTGLGALTVGGEMAGLAAVLVVAADNLGMRHSALPAAAFVGSQVGLGVVLGSLLGQWVPVPTERLSFVRPVLCGAVVVSAGLIAAKSAFEPAMTVCIAVGATAGIVLQLLLADEEGESSRVGLAAVVGIGLATVAFGLGKGVGLALAALAAVGVLIAVENRRAVLALGPLVGLTLYRVLREAGTGATRALEINQNYTILALVIGLCLPLLPTDWLRRRGRRSESAGSFLWGIVAVAAAPLVVAAFGMRGGVGFVVGLGITGLVQAFHGFPLSVVDSPSSRPSLSQSEGGVTLLPLALGAGLSGATVLALGWMGPESSLSRDDKLRLFEYAAAGIAIVSILLAFVGRPTKTETVE